MRQEVARFVQQVDGRAAIRDGDVNVKAENQQRAGELLHFLDDVLVSFAGGEHLIDPAGEGMRSRRGNAQSHALGAVGQIPADATDLMLELVHVGTDLRPNLHD